MKKDIIMPVIFSMLLTQAAFAERIPNFVDKSTVDITSNIDLASLIKRDVNVFPNPDKWILLGRNNEGYCFWYSPQEILVTNREDKRVKAKVMTYNPKRNNYYIFKHLLNYTENSDTNLEGIGFDPKTGKQNFQSSNQSWIGKKTYFGDNGKRTRFVQRVYEYLDNPNNQLTSNDTFNQSSNNTFYQNNSNYSNNGDRISNYAVLPNHAYIPARTKLRVELLDRMDSKKSTRNQLIAFKTTENLIINGTVVIPAGTVGKGQIYDLQKPAGFGRKGVVRMAAQEIKTLNNITVPLMGGLGGQGKTDGGSIAVAAVVSLAGGFLMKGSGVTFEAGTNFFVEVKQDTDLGVTFDNLKEAMNPSVPHGNEIILPVR